jgi:hypothetical protein
LGDSLPCLAATPCLTFRRKSVEVVFPDGKTTPGDSSAMVGFSFCGSAFPMAPWPDEIMILQ